MGYLLLTRAAIETAKICIPTILQALVNRTDLDKCDRRLASWSKRLVVQAKIDLHVEGREHIAPGQSYVVMSNHQSHYDIPVVFQALQVPVRMVAKTELFQIPIMGRAMHDSGFVEIDRKNRRRAIEQLGDARKRIEEHGFCIWIAPEGTRSRDGKLQTLKAGGFHVAKGTQVPILPVSVDGTFHVHQRGDDRIHQGRRVTVRIHPPIDAEDVKRSRVPDLSERVKEAIASGLTNPAPY